MRSWVHGRQGGFGRSGVRAGAQFTKCSCFELSVLNQRCGALAHLHFIRTCVHPGAPPPPPSAYHTQPDSEEEEEEEEEGPSPASQE